VSLTIIFGDVATHLAGMQRLYYKPTGSGKLEKSKIFGMGRDNGPQAHYPSVLYDAASFGDGAGQPQYKMWYDNGSITAVTLSHFTAQLEGEQVTITWTTVQEINSLGFGIYRSETPAGKYLKINEVQIPSLSPGSLIGADYLWIDRTIQPGVRYRYQLEDIDLQSVGTLHGPAYLDAPEVQAFKVYFILAQPHAVHSSEMGYSHI